MVTYYVLFFIHLGTRKVYIGGITPNPDQRWIAQIVRNITDIDDSVLLQNNCKYLIHDRDSKFCEHFDSLLRSVKIEPVKLPPRSPNLNAYAERFILSRGHFTMCSRSISLITTSNVIIRALGTTSFLLKPPQRKAANELSSAEKDSVGC